MRKLQEAGLGIKKILVIDDEPDTIAYVTALLEDHAYRVSSAHSTEAGLFLVEREIPDLILVDVMMPGASGLSLVQTLRTTPRFSTIPVIMLTGRAEILKDGGCSYLNRFRISPPEGILEKPFEPEALLNLLKSLLPPQPPI